MMAKGFPMHVQIINFNLKDATEAQYRALCDDLAPTFGAMPGLLTKYWLADAATNTYGGVYIWENRAAMEAYMNGEVAAAVIAHPNLANISSKDYDILESPTQVTRGFAAVAAA
jgi:quinol monooxygenase YgiN